MKIINIPDHTVNDGESEPYIIVVSMRKSHFLRRICERLFPNYVTNKHIVVLFDARKSIAPAAFNFGNHKNVEVFVCGKNRDGITYFQLLCEIYNGLKFDISRIVLYSTFPDQSNQVFSVSNNKPIGFEGGLQTQTPYRENDWSPMVAEIKSTLEVNLDFKLSVPVFNGADLILYVYPKSVT